MSKSRKVEVIVDDPAPNESEAEVVWIPDEEARGYEHLMSHPRNFPSITSWSRAFVHLARTLRPGGAVWFVEDDVAGDADSFRELIAGTARIGADLSALEFEAAADNPDWIWFPTAEGFFKRPWRSFNPLCRLSEKLVRHVLEFREEHGRMTFHEVLFASLADEGGMSILDWQKESELKHLVANFRYRPVIRFPIQGVCHPVKDLELVNLLCEAPAPEFARMGSAKLSGYSILSEDYVFLSRLCREMGLRRIVEFGPGDSTLAFRDAECEVISYEHDESWLEKARELFEGDESVDLRDCDRDEVPSDDSSMEGVGLVFVDGPPQIEGDEMSRLKVCEWAMMRHGIFLLHDAKRESEKRILEVFRDQGAEVLEIPTRKGMALVFDRRSGTSFGGLGTETIGGFPRGERLGWKILVGNERQPMKVLAIGGGEEEGVLAEAKGLFPHSESSFHQVLKPDSDISGIQEGRAAESYEGESVEVLSWMIANDGYWESFDAILVDQEVPAFELLRCVCQAWALLKPGGLMGFCRFEENVAGEVNCEVIDLLVKSLGGEVSVVLRGERCVLLKLGI